MLALLAAMLIALVGGWQVLRSREAALGHAEAEARTLARTLAQHAGRTMEAVDLSLGMLADAIEAGRDPRAAARDIRRRNALGQVRSLAVADASGAWLSDAPPDAADAGAAHALLAWLADPRESRLFFTPSPAKRTSDSAGFSVARRISRPDGTFAGAVVARLSPDYFRTFYETVRIGPQGVIGLWTDDGRMLVRYPQLPDGKGLTGPLASAAKAFAGPGSVIRSRSPLDGIERLSAFEHVETYPLVVAAGIAVEDALATWRHEALVEGSVVAAAAVMLAVLGLVLEGRRRHLLALEAASAGAERAFAESEHRLNRQLEHGNRLMLLAEEIAQVGHWRLELPNNHLIWSDQVYRLHGLDPATFAPDVEAAIGLHHPHDRAEIGRAVAGAIESRRNFEVALRIVRPGGEVRHVLSRGLCELGADGAVAAVFGTIMDVTEMRKAEQAVLDSEARYRTLAEMTGDIITRLGLDFRRQYVSPACRAILGYEPEELMGVRPSDAMHPDDAPAARALAARLAAGEIEGDRVVSTYRTRHKAGRYVRVETAMRLERDAAGAPAALICSIRDVTARWRAEQALAASEARWSFALESSGQGVWDSDLERRRTFYSAAWKATLGYADDEIETSPSTWLDLMHPDDRAGALEADRKVLEGRAAVFDGEFRMRHKDGRWVWIHDRGQVVKADASGRPLRIIGVHTDVTARKAIERELREAKERAEAAARTKADFVANMSHELRTPLTGIIGVLELLRADPALGAAQRRLVELAGQAGHSLLGIVNDVLDFSKIDAGRLALESVPFDLDELVTGCLELARNGLNGKPIDISLVRQPDRLGLFKGDPTRIRQVLLNLLTNAVKFTPSGRIVVRAAYRKEDARLRVEVSDSGIGIPVDRLAMLFERFTQADTSMTRRFGGTGLGLAICRQLVELMAGRIGAENQPEGGSLFWFEVPLSRGAAVAARSDTSAAVSGLRILLAEDNALNAEIIAAMLKLRGHVVTTVADGAAAVAAAGSVGAFDLVLMDMQMPVIDGLGAARRIREREASAGLARLPVVGLTANALEGDAERCLAAGMDGHVVKPIDWSQLFGMIERLGRPVADGRSPAPEADLSKVLALDRLQELSALIGRERLHGMLLRFVDDLKARMALIETGDAAVLSDQTHALVATAGQFGFHELSALCIEINQEVREGRGRDRIGDVRRAAERAAEAALRSGFATAA